MMDKRNILMMAAVGILALGTVAMAQAEAENPDPRPWQGGPRWQGRGERPGPPFARGPQNRPWQGPGQDRPGRGGPDLLDRLADRLELTEAQRAKLEEIKRDLGRVRNRMQAAQMRNRAPRPAKGRPAQRMGRGQPMRGGPAWGPGRGFGGPGMDRGPAQRFGQRQGAPRGPQMQAAPRPEWGPGRNQGRPGRGQGMPGMRGEQRPGSGGFPLERLFEKADSNDDGLLSRAELQAIGNQRRAGRDAPAR